MSSILLSHLAIGTNLLYATASALLIYGVFLRLRKIRKAFQILPIGIHYLHTSRAAIKYQKMLSLVHKHEEHYSYRKFESYSDLTNDIAVMHYLENNLVFQKSRLIDCLETDIMPIPEDEILEFFRLEESQYRKTIMDERHIKSKATQRNTIGIDVNYPEMATS